MVADTMRMMHWKHRWPTFLATFHYWVKTEHAYVCAVVELELPSLNLRVGLENNMIKIKIIENSF